MHNAIFLAQQNELLRNTKAKQTSKRSNSTKRIAFENGVTIGETPAPIPTPNQAFGYQTTQGDEVIQMAM